MGKSEEIRRYQKPVGVGYPKKCGTKCWKKVLKRVWKKIVPKMLQYSPLRFRLLDYRFEGVGALRARRRRNFLEIPPVRWHFPYKNRDFHLSLIHYHGVSNKTPPLKPRFYFYPHQVLIFPDFGSQIWCAGSWFSLSKPQNFRLRRSLCKVKSP